MHRNKFRLIAIVEKPGPEYMVLVNAVRYLILPDPSSPKLVPVTSFVEEDVTGFELKLLGGCGWNSDGSNLTEVKVASLDISDTKVGNFHKSRIILLLDVLGHTTHHISNLTKGNPRTRALAHKGQGGQLKPANVGECPIQRRQTGIETRELLLYDTDDTLLFLNGG